MVQICESQSKDKEQIIKCANEAFGEELPEGGFSQLLPKLYGEYAVTERNHLLAIEDGQILGLLLKEPVKYLAKKEELSIAAIGTVCVSPKARGRGIMKRLMDEAVQSLRQANYDCAVLGGQRQRYAYWGFEPCGTQMYFRWNQANLTHTYGQQTESALTLVPMKRADWQTEEAFALWEQKTGRALREKSRFFDILCSWNGIPYACLKAGTFAGYVVLETFEREKKVRILEMVLREEIAAGMVLCAIRKELGISAGTVNVLPCDQRLLTELEEICEEERLEWNHKFLILNWVKVLKAMMEMKNSWQPLKDGRVILGIQESDRQLLVLIEVKEGKITVEQVEKGEDEAVVELSAKKAARILFRHTLARTKEMNQVPEGWFPLPLYLNEQDCC